MQFQFLKKINIENIKILEILQGQFTGLHFIKATLKLFKPSDIYIFVPKNDKLSVPLLTELTRGLKTENSTLSYSELCLLI